MKPRIAIIAALFVTLTCTVFLMGQSPAVAEHGQAPAQAAPAGPAGAAPRAVNNTNQILIEGSLPQLAKELSLSESQQAEARGILQNQQAQISQLKQDNSIQPPERKQQVTAIRAATSASIRALLNDNQKQTYDQMQGPQNRPGNPVAQTK